MVDKNIFQQGMQLKVKNQGQSPFTAGSIVFIQNEDSFSNNVITVAATIDNNPYKNSWCFLIKNLEIHYE